MGGSRETPAIEVTQLRRNCFNESGAQCTLRLWLVVYVCNVSLHMRVCVFVSVFLCVLSIIPQTDTILKLEIRADTAHYNLGKTEGTFLPA